MIGVFRGSCGGDIASPLITVRIVTTSWSPWTGQPPAKNAVDRSFRMRTSLTPGFLLLSGPSPLWAGLKRLRYLKVFYPTDLMSTGFDIIFFWVARMIMMGLKFMKDVPFREVFINGLVRDLKKRKMSKSEGNIIDPLEMIDKYGTDALRFTLASLAVPGMDIALSEERMAGYRAFANKIWNASRFVLMNLGEEKLEPDQQALSLPNRWIRSRLTRVIEQLNDSLKNYKFYEAAETIYHFIWHEFCDWYIEFIKPELKESNKNTQAVMEDTLDKILKLLHPFMSIYHRGNLASSAGERPVLTDRELARSQPPLAG